MGDILLFPKRLNRHSPDLFLKFGGKYGEMVIEQIRTDDKADFNSNRQFYRRASDFGEYPEGTVDRRTLQIRPAELVEIKPFRNFVLSGK